MPYITRDDGIHFVIPSYREVLLAKYKGALQKDLMALSQSYGDYITLQRKNPQQYEVAFSPDPGYSLGETVWSYFNRPMDMIYCEAIPNTTEVIMVIVKSGSVYLDGSFPVESIPEELVIFLTQQNNFEIFVYGNVPLSEKPEEGKFSFDASSVKSFKVLDQPVFKNLPLLKIYQFQLLDVVLKEHGIGVFPVKQLMVALAGIGVAVFLISAIVNYKPAPPPEEEMEPNPYQGYVDTLASPAPDLLIQAFTSKLDLIQSIQGWEMISANFKGNSIDVQIKSNGSSIEDLMQWASDHGSTVIITANGIILSVPVESTLRAKPKIIYPLKDVLAVFVDRLAKVYPGNVLTLVKGQDTGTQYYTMKVTLKVELLSPSMINLLAEQIKDLPFTLEEINAIPNTGLMNGTITLVAYGK